MPMRLIVILLLFSSLTIIACSKQGPTISQACPCADSVTDNSTSTKFYLDSARINVYAFKKDKLIWKTNPRKDGHLENYREDNPVIYYIGLQKRRGENELLRIAYTNSQFGNLDKVTGEFMFQGQD
jgi:hypothetical protein